MEAIVVVSSQELISIFRNLQAKFVVNSIILKQITKFSFNILLKNNIADRFAWVGHIPNLYI